MAYTSSLTLTSFALGLEKCAATGDDLEHAIGQAGKGSALRVAERDLGADRRFSGLRKGKAAALSAGYDTGNPVILHLRPEGLWILADGGRRRSGQIRPKPARRRAERKPRGRAAIGRGGRFVKVGRYRPARGQNTINDALDDMETTVPEAFMAVIDERIAAI